MTNETFSKIRHIYLGLSIFGHILKDFIKIPIWDISQLGISLVSTDLVFFSIT